MEERGSVFKKSPNVGRYCRMDAFSCGWVIIVSYNNRRQKGIILSTISKVHQQCRLYRDRMRLSDTFILFHRSASMLQYANAVQGTQLGDFAIAWRFENLPADKTLYDSAAVKIRIRMLVPPTAEAIIRLPIPTAKRTKVWLSASDSFPDLVQVRNDAESKCHHRRNRKLGFPYSFEYDRQRKEWFRLTSSKAIGTSCESFLFDVMPLDAQWNKHEDITKKVFDMKDTSIKAGLYEIIINNYQLEQEIEGNGRLGDIPEYYEEDFDAGPYCKDHNAFDWHVNDATHII